MFDPVPSPALARANDKAEGSNTTPPYFEYELELKLDAAFKIRSTRAIPHEISDNVKAESVRMVGMGVTIKLEEPTPVVRNPIVVRKNQGADESWWRPSII